MLKEEELNNIKSMGSLCELATWFDKNGEIHTIGINGVEIEYQDFGEKSDICPQCAPEYGCGYMQFEPYEYVKEETLKKYNITEEEYRKIQEKLDCLSFGNCSWCV